MLTASKQKVAIVGAGIIGAFCALYLRRFGHTVEIFDQFPTAFSGSTAAGFGSLTPFSDPYFRGPVSTFAQQSVALYRTDVVSALGPVHISEDSLLHLLTDEKEKSYVASKLDIYSEDVPRKYKWLTVDDVSKLEPNLTKDYLCAVEYLEPWIDLNTLLPKLHAKLSSDSGCNIRLSTTISSIQERAGKVILTDGGGTKHEADVVVMATGASLSAIEGIVRPNLELIRGDGALVWSSDGVPLVSRHVYMGNSFVTPRLDGRHLLGATYEKLEASPSEAAWDQRQTAKVRHLSDVLTGALKLIPKIGDYEVSRVWHGWRPSTPSGLPFVGIVPGSSAIWAALGFIGLGLTLAPAVGKGLAAAISGEDHSIPPELTAPQAALWGGVDG